MSNNLDDIKFMISNLEKIMIHKFDEIDKKIEVLVKCNKDNEQKMDVINIECQKMGSHIDFIEETYTTLQTPLNYVKRSVERLIGTSTNDLKNLPLKDETKK